MKYNKIDDAVFFTGNSEVKEIHIISSIPMSSVSAFHKYQNTF